MNNHEVFCFFLRTKGETDPVFWKALSLSSPSGALPFMDKEARVYVCLHACAPALGEDRTQQTLTFHLRLISFMRFLFCFLFSSFLPCRVVNPSLRCSVPLFPYKAPQVLLSLPEHRLPALRAQRQRGCLEAAQPRG